MPVELRPYQNDMIGKARTLLGKVPSVLIQAPTGAGKTALSSMMAGTAASKGKSVIFIVHRRELIKQSMRAFAKAGVPFGVIAPTFRMDLSQPVQIASIQSLSGKAGRFVKTPDLVIFDECHHAPAGTWAAVCKRFEKARRVGLSATPQRLDGTGLDDFFSAMVRGPSVSWLIENGFLSPYRYFASEADVSKLRTTAGDFHKKDAAEAFDKPTITGDAVSHYLRLCPGKRAVVFACSVEHSKNIVAAFIGMGIPAEHVDGSTKTEERDAAIERLKSGETLVLSNVDLFGEGFDLPAIECVIMLRPTQSLAMFLQWCGRGLRMSEGKSVCWILDHAGNSSRHGLPDDEREWTLQGKPKKKRGEREIRENRICAECFATNASDAAQCFACGTVFVAKDRTQEYAYDPSDLQEIDKASLRRKLIKEQAKAETLEDLIALGQTRGYKPGWAHKIWQLREKREDNKKINENFIQKVQDSDFDSVLSRLIGG